MEENASVKKIFSQLLIDRVPSYANKIFYSLGFLSMICFTILIITGVIMVAYGPNWWLTDATGQFLRSAHLWATQAFVLFMLLHILIVFLTGGYKKPRRLTWVVGAVMFFFVLAEAEFGYVLRGDFSSQYRSLQGADLFNGGGIGGFLNELNYRQIFGIHVVAVPLLILGLLFVHYVLIKARGIAKPHIQNVTYKMVKANHMVLFLRGAVLVAALVGLAYIFPSPFIRPTTIQEVAQQDPQLMSQTLMQEFTKTSDTATYLDNIDPYKYDVRQIYIMQPYEKLVALQHTADQVKVFNAEALAVQNAQLKQATDYFGAQTNISVNDPVVTIVSSLTVMAQSGLYEASLAGASASGDQTTYIARFLGDTGVLDTKAEQLGITTQQYGMLKEETSKFPLGAWWLAPIGLLDHTILANDNNGDRDGAIIIGLLVLLLIAFPYIPYLNNLPDKLKVYKLIWGKRGKTS
jgi:hypothetical protein